jgi:hypothetical protein
MRIVWGGVAESERGALLFPFPLPLPLLMLLLLFPVVLLVPQPPLVELVNEFTPARPVGSELRWCRREG